VDYDAMRATMARQDERLAQHDERLARLELMVMGHPPPLFYPPQPQPQPQQWQAPVVRPMLPDQQAQGTQSSSPPGLRARAPSPPPGLQWPIRPPQY
jgi:hypothetical protein